MRDPEFLNHYSNPNDIYVSYILLFFEIPLDKKNEH